MSIVRSLFQVNNSPIKPPEDLKSVHTIPAKFQTNIEEELLKKYSSLKSEVKKKFNRKTVVIRKDQENFDNIVLLDSLNNMDDDSVNMLMALCPDIKSKTDAKFFLEATFYNIEEAEKLYYEQKQEVQEFIKVNIRLPDGRDIFQKFVVTESMWEICALIYRSTNQSKEPIILNLETGKEITIEELASMSFKEYGFTNNCNLKVSYPN